MQQVLVIFASILSFVHPVYHFDIEESSLNNGFTMKYNGDGDMAFLVHYDYVEHQQNKEQTVINDQDGDFEPVFPPTKEREKVMTAKNIDCEDFGRYSQNCTWNAAIMYNSNRKSPPLPSKLGDWCRAIRFLTNCAIDWNTDCGEVVDNKFNEESIRGHMHVLDNVCDDEWFLAQYAELFACIAYTANAWEKCYLSFRAFVDQQKNSTKDWTHYETHFYLCCARAQFRRCTLDAVFSSKPYCSHNQSIVLQKFSTIVSEGDVYQDCELNMMYSHCPGGDPRPSTVALMKLMEPVATSDSSRQRVMLILTLITMVLM